LLRGNAPNQIATLTVKGNYAQVAGSAYNVNINSSLQNSLIAVNGTAYLFWRDRQRPTRRQAPIRAACATRS